MPLIKVAVIGATGGTGRAVIENALAAGHEVIAVARRPESVKIQNKRLDVRRGDVLEPHSISQAIGGADAIVSAIGIGRAKEPTKFYSDGIANIIATMREAKARRLICVGASGYVDEPRHPVWIRFLQKNFVQKLFRHSYDDMMKMEEAVRQSELDWTIVRPPRLVNGRRTEFYRVQKELVIGGAKISRADIADYIVKCLCDSRTFCQACGVAY